MDHPTTSSFQENIENVIESRESISQHYHSESSYSTDVVQIDEKDYSLFELESLIDEQSRRILRIIAENEKKETGRRDADMTALQKEYEEKYEKLYQQIDRKVAITESESSEEVKKQLGHLTSERDKLRREIDFFKSHYHMQKTDINKLTEEIESLREKHAEARASLEKTKFQLEEREKELQIHRGFKCKTKDSNSYVIIQNMLNVLVKLQDDINKKLHKIQKDVQNKHRETLTGIDVMIREENRNMMSRKMTTYERELKRHTEKRQNQVSMLKQSHEEETKALYKQIEAYQELLSKETVELDSIHADNEMSISTVDTKHYSASSVTFVFSPIVHSTKLQMATQILEACINAMEHQAGMRNHQVHSILFQQIWGKATGLLSGGMASALSTLFGMGGHYDKGEKNTQERWEGEEKKEGEGEVE